MILESRVDRSAQAFAENRTRMGELVEELRERSAQVAKGGGEKAIERHRSRGKLLARERIDRLTDPGSSFLELARQQALGLYGALIIDPKTPVATTPAYDMEYTIQLQEWLEDRDDPKNEHRHVSHLWGLHPGSEITPRTPELS